MSIKTFIIGVSTAAAITAASAVAVAAATIDLAFAIDESGSVTGQPNQATSELGLVRNGLAAALDQIPSVGAPGNPNTYRVTVVRFAGSASQLVATTVIDDTTRPIVQNTLRTAPRTSGNTNIGAAINLMTNLVCPGGTCQADTTIFNVATDGVGSLGTAPADAAAAGVDSLNFEAIGTGASTAPLLNVAFPGTPQLVTDATMLPNPLNDSFVLQVATFGDFEAAISAKVGRIVIDTGGGSSPIPLPAGLPLLLAGLGALTVLRRRASS